MDNQEYPTVPQPNTSASNPNPLPLDANQAQNTNQPPNTGQPQYSNPSPTTNQPQANATVQLTQQPQTALNPQQSAPGTSPQRQVQPTSSPKSQPISDTPAKQQSPPLQQAQPLPGTPMQQQAQPLPTTPAKQPAQPPPDVPQQQQAPPPSSPQPTPNTPPQQQTPPPSGTPPVSPPASPPTSNQNETQPEKPRKLSTTLLIIFTVLASLLIVAGSTAAGYFLIFSDDKPEEITSNSNNEEHPDDLEDMWTEESDNEIDSAVGEKYVVIIGSDPEAPDPYTGLEANALIAYDLFVKYLRYDQSNVYLLVNRDSSWVEEWEDEGGIYELGAPHDNPPVYIDPTSINFADTLNTLSETITADDRLVVFIFTHGSQIDDQNSDESDGIDEAIVLNDRDFLDDDLAALLSKSTPKEMIIFTKSCYGAGLIKDIEDKVDENTRLRIIATAPEELPSQGNMVEAGSDFDFAYPDRWQDPFGILLFGLTDMKPGEIASRSEPSKNIEEIYSIFSDSCEQEDMEFEAHIVEVEENPDGGSIYKCIFCEEYIIPTEGYQPIYGYFNSDFSEEFSLD